MGNTESKKNTAAGLEGNQWIFHPIKYVKVLDKYMLKVMFCTGTEKLINMRPYIEKYEHFSALKDGDLFSRAHLECDTDYAVIWNDSIDISSEELWAAGTTTATAFSGLLSMREATEKFGLDESTIRKAISNGRFKIGEDVFKFGKQWVLVSAAVDREYMK